MDQKTMELVLFDPENERLKPDYGLPNEENTDIDEAKKSQQPLFRSNLPPDIEEFYSASGIKLTSPLIFLHFYPDGTSDSIIIKYKDRPKPYHFIPRNGGKGVFLADIENLSNEN